MYTIWYVDEHDRVEKTQGGFDTLERINRNHAIINVKNPDGDSITTVVGGMLDDIRVLQQRGRLDAGEPHQ